LVQRTQVGAWMLACLLFWSSISAAHAQSKAELQRQRDAITAQLATTERLLTTAKKNRSNAVAELQLVDQRIALREQLIRHHKQEIASLEREMAGTDSEIRTLEGHIAQLKDEYARMIVQAYRMRVPRLVQARMVINGVVDALLGVRVVDPHAKIPGDRRHSARFPKSIRRSSGVC
jgi:septal ring factor EnvC (AmiA/AmiB activator)